MFVMNLFVCFMCRSSVTPVMCSCVLCIQISLKFFQYYSSSNVERGVLRELSFLTEMAETQSGAEDIVVIPDSESIPLTKASPPGTPSGLVEGHSKFFDQRDRAMQATEQSGGSTTSRSQKSAGVAFSGGGIRSAAFCSGALRRMLLKNVLPDYLSCVSGGGYTGAAFVEWKEWKRRNRDNGDDSKWHDEFFDTMRQNAGYLCDWQFPFVGLWHSVVFVVLLVTVVFILPCVLWLPYAFPIAVAVDVLFGKILRQNATCPPSAHALTDPMTSRTSSLMLMLYENCHSPSRRTALIVTTFICSLLFYFLSRKKRLHKFKDISRLFSMISFIVFLFTLFPLLIHDLWPSNTWVRAFIIIICIVLPFFIPVIRNYASVFLVFYWYIEEDIRVNFLKIKSQQRPRSYQFRVQYYDEDDNKTGEGEILFIAPRHPSESIPLARIVTQQPKSWENSDVELRDPDQGKWGRGPEITENEADRLTGCCCLCCHGNSCQYVSNLLQGSFPHHITANQFFTPDMFTVYHREGYAASVEADVSGFLKTN
ncbi:uncharacterized protein LOC111327285 [Stylophora pistillata]|uniref:uncharacterized protein LOC111327285 n=1 Tax=Stylophora pistillata TaxID=50429 RepID=UPI000C045BDF|nr:uncharacterized protein LOC111327285 [Stylophora pistillata]